MMTSPIAMTYCSYVNYNPDLVKCSSNKMLALSIYPVMLSSCNFACLLTSTDDKLPQQHNNLTPMIPDLKRGRIT